MSNKETAAYEYEDELYPSHADPALQERRYRKRIRRKKRRRMMRICALLFVLTAVLLVMFARSSFFDIQRVTVRANEYYTEEQIIDMCKAETGINIFKAGKGDMIQLLEKDPYIESAEIKRHLPAELIITVKERKETAAVYSGKKYYITDGSGLVLKVVKKDPPATVVSGYKVISGEVNSPIEVDDKATFTKTLSMLAQADSADISFIKVTFKGRILKAYIYDNLYVRGTAEDIQASIKSGALEAVMYDLTKKDIKNGMVRVGDEDYCVFSPEN